MIGKAVVFTDRLKVSVQEVEIPEPHHNEVVIDVEVSWISNGTESSFLRGERIAGDTPYHSNAAWPFPIVAGYQKVGVIRQIGSEVSGLQVGDRVFATISRVTGMFNPYGGHINPAVTAADQVWKLPEGANSIDYCGLVLTQVGYNCGMRASVRNGDCVVVIGDGLVGQWTVQTLLNRGARVMVLGRHDERLRYLPDKAVGINTRLCSFTEAVSDFAGSDGISVLVDTVGDLTTVEQCFQPFRRNAHFVSAGFYGLSGKIDIQKLRDKEITLHAPAGWTKERMDAARDGIRDQWLQTGALVTHRFPVNRADEAWQLIVGKSEPSLGVILEW
ncbi:zinc-binding dehydrogenase [Paenibacillus periandrae]|uniref:zinc-binding dehydrogenase n=1 Tax=Paenibacillus periandrae TaxID=1761741 RepID=UPI001F0991E0|nr:zinc-binding dehydrogenase [Paenibacillus periandrae]